MSTNWRISSFNGALLAAYFIPTWTIIAVNMMVSPIHAFFDRPNVSVAFFISDHLHLAAGGMIRAAWLLALGRLTVVLFFAIFLVMLSRPAIRKAGGANEALGMALGIGSVISFAAMLMASQVGEVEARATKTRNAARNATTVMRPSASSKATRTVASPESCR